MENYTVSEVGPRKDVVNPVHVSLYWVLLPVIVLIIYIVSLFTLLFVYKLSWLTDAQLQIQISQLMQEFLLFILLPIPLLVTIFVVTLISSKYNLLKALLIGVPLSIIFSFIFNAILGMLNIITGGGSASSIGIALVITPFTIGAGLIVLFIHLALLHRFTKQEYKSAKEFLIPKIVLVSVLLGILFSGVLFHTSIVQEYAIKTASPATCNIIENSLIFPLGEGTIHLPATCISKVAVKNSNSDICNVIDENTNSRRRNECFAMVSLGNNSKTGCEQIQVMSRVLPYVQCISGTKNADIIDILYEDRTLYECEKKETNTEAKQCIKNYINENEDELEQLKEDYGE